MHAAVKLLPLSHHLKVAANQAPRGRRRLRTSKTRRRRSAYNEAHRYLQMVRPKDKLRLRAPCHAEPVNFVYAPHHLKVATRQALPRRRGFLVDLS